MVRSRDDVIVIDRCFRQRRYFRRLAGASRDVTNMMVGLFANGALTPGTRVFSEADGTEFHIFLPNGTNVKVIVDNLQLNVWIYASPKDFRRVQGLCGTFDNIPDNDIQLRNGTLSDSDRERFFLNWRVSLGGPCSLLNGVPPSTEEPQQDPLYCECGYRNFNDTTKCGVNRDVFNCDKLKKDSQDITQWLIDNPIVSTPPGVSRSGSRVKRQSAIVSAVNAFDSDPISVDVNFIPPVYNWTNNWNSSRAAEFCNRYLRSQFNVGTLCSQVPGVHISDQVATCMADIKITGNTAWADSARSALKEQCSDSLNRNDSIPSYVVSTIQARICPNQCSGRGRCVNGTCACDAQYGGVDCSVNVQAPPYADRMPAYGLCNLRRMNCSRVIVYGQNFNHSPLLTCRLNEAVVDSRGYVPLNRITLVRAVFLNFNAVECQLPHIRSYLIQIGNNRVNYSDPLLYIPYDPVCRNCSTNTTTCVQFNDCVLDERCYAEGESSPPDRCLVCRRNNGRLQWRSTTSDGCTFSRPRVLFPALPGWLIAIIGGACFILVSFSAGFCCCMCLCKKRANEWRTDRPPITTRRARVRPNSTPFANSVNLHRSGSCGDPLSNTSRRFPSYARHQGPYEETHFRNYHGQGVENGVNDNTYF